MSDFKAFKFVPTGEIRRAQFGDWIWDTKKECIRQWLNHAESHQNVLIYHSSFCDPAAEAAERAALVDIQVAASNLRCNIATLPIETQKLIDYNGWLTALRNNLDAFQRQAGEKV